MRVYDENWTVSASVTAAASKCHFRRRRRRQSPSLQSVSVARSTVQLSSVTVDTRRTCCCSPVVSGNTISRTLASYAAPVGYFPPASQVPTSRFHFFPFAFRKPVPFSRIVSVELTSTVRSLLPRDAMLARCMLWPRVCPSVRLSQVGVLSKRLNESG